jgi:histidinol-phosphate/aromatic aminotransferase/cobyric acid decarboxylase-like protein
MADYSTNVCQAFHGGRFFEAIGTDFKELGRAETVISADVLDAWFDPSPQVIRKLQEFLPFLLRTSPPVHGDGLIRMISQARGIPTSNLCVGGGSSQLIFTCLPALTSSKGPVLILDPMYGEYSHVLERVLQRDVHRHYLREEDRFTIDVGLLLEHVQQVQPELLVIVNPNSPTGQHWPRREMLEFLQHVPDTLCLVDETYIDYLAGAESLENAIGRFPNLVILKSMSKVYALSGLRVAYLAASEEIVREIAGRLPPWSVSLPAQVAAVEALRDPEYYRDRYLETHGLRSQVLEQLREILGIQIFDSCANFYLVKSTQQSATTIQSQLESEGIFIRHCDSMSARFQDNFLRIAVKAKDQNCRIAAALEMAFSRRLAHISGA